MKALVIIAIIVLALAFGFGLVPFLIMICWNFLAPLFGGPVITFWHALAVTVLLSVLSSFFKQRK